MPKVSVIVPAYNVEMYIEKCLNSILHQTFNDFEVIIINDGSNDGTLSICEQFIGKMPNLSIINKSNEGQAIARNDGTKKAIGDYICYVDSDDWISPKYIETLYCDAIKYDADIVQCNHFYAFDSYVMYANRSSGVKHLNTEMALMELVRHRCIQNFPWGKLIKRDVAKKCPFPNIKNFEDIYWFYKIIHNSNKYVIVDSIQYYYRQRIGSMTASFNETSLLLIDGTECRLDFIIKNYPQLTKIALKSYFETFLSLYNNAVNDSMFVREYGKRRNRVLEKYKHISRNSGGNYFKFKVISSSLFTIRAYDMVKKICHRLMVTGEMKTLRYNQTHRYEN